MLKNFLSKDKAHSTLMTFSLIFGFIIPLVTYLIQNFTGNMFVANNSNYALSSIIFSFVFSLNEYLTIAVIILSAIKFNFKKAFLIMVPTMIGYAVIWIIKIINGGIVAPIGSEYFTIELIVTIFATIARIATPLIIVAIAYLIKKFNMKNKAKFLITSAFFILIFEGMNVFNNISNYLALSNGFIDSQFIYTIITGVALAAIFYLAMMFFEKYFDIICDKMNKSPKNKKTSQPELIN